MAHDLATSLRSIRETARLSRRQLAELSGVSARSIEAYERGDAVPSVLAARDLAAALDCTVDELLAGMAA